MLARTSQRYDAQGGQQERATTFMDKLPGLIAQSVRQAHERLSPAKVSAAIGRVEGLAFNRRFFMRDGSVGWNPGKLNPNIVRPAGPTDPDLPVVFFEGARNKPIATYANFAIHLDTVSGTEISANAPGTLTKLLAAATDPDLVTVYATACCGDINHYDVSRQTPQKGHGEAARIGTHLAAGVLRAIERIRPVAAGPLRMRSEIVQLPLPRVDPAEVEPARTVAECVATRAMPARSSWSRSTPSRSSMSGPRRQAAGSRGAGRNAGRRAGMGQSAGRNLRRARTVDQTGLPLPSDDDRRAGERLNRLHPEPRCLSAGKLRGCQPRCGEGSGELLVDTALRLLRQLYAEEMASRRK